MGRVSAVKNDHHQAAPDTPHLWQRGFKINTSANINVMMAAATIILSLGAGCIGEDRPVSDARVSTDDSTGADSADQDSSACVPAECVSDDPCTSARCEGQRCVREAISACIDCRGDGDGACEDDNPCTSDACVEGRCQNAPVGDGAPCAGCNFACEQGLCTQRAPADCAQAADCEDFDPCTIDACVDACVCQNRVDRKCATCSNADLTPIRDVPQDSGGTVFKVAGTVRHGRADACAAVAENCEACSGELAFGSDENQLTLGPSEGTFRDWTCDWVQGPAGCEQAQSCVPLMAGGAYLVWGTTAPAVGGGGGGADEGTAMSVEGWCLRPNVRGLLGSYASETIVLTSFTSAVPDGMKLRLSLTIARDEDGGGGQADALDVTVGVASCAECIGLQSAQLHSAQIVDSRLLLSYTITLDNLDSALMESHLRPVNNSLTGPSRVLAYTPKNTQPIEGSSDAPLAAGETVFNR